jgi:putative methyltransferase (TIGR04325 family)
MSLRGALRELLPAAALRAVAGKPRTLRFEGDYPDWEAALKASGAYDNVAIVSKMLDAELAVKSGRAADARDGVVFESIQFSFPVMAGLGRIARGHEPLRVVDFGGAFGGTYRQYKAFHGNPVSWAVVDQPHVVDLGGKHFTTGELEFHPTLESALAAGPADAVVLSSVLQYLREPYRLISDIARTRIGHVIVDRTPCSELPRDVLAVQHVPAEIYAASYPCWIFSRQRLLGAFGEHFVAVASFTDGSGAWRGEAAAFQLAGFILDRRLAAES